MLGAIYIGEQELPNGGSLSLFNLLIDTPTHPKGSTVCEKTLISLGIEIPEKKKENLS